MGITKNKLTRLLTLSVSIELVSSLARVTSVKSQQPLGVSEWQTSGPKRRLVSLQPWWGDFMLCPLRAQEMKGSSIVLSHCKHHHDLHVFPPRCWYIIMIINIIICVVISLIRSEAENLPGKLDATEENISSVVKYLLDGKISPQWENIPKSCFGASSQRAGKFCQDQQDGDWKTLIFLVLLCPIKTMWLHRKIPRWETVKLKLKGDAHCNQLYFLLSCAASPSLQIRYLQSLFSQTSPE